MSIATIYNPLSTNKPKLFVFYNDLNGRLNLLQWTAPDTSKVMYKVNYADSSAKIHRLTALTTFMHNNIIQLYTVINIRTTTVATDPGKNLLVSVSPIYQNLEIETRYTQIAGCSDGENGWIYYLGKKGNTITLVEQTLDSEENNQIAESFMIWSDETSATKLGSCYTPSDHRRYVCFQDGDKNLIVYDVIASKDVGIDNSGDSLAGTWLAVCTYPRATNEDVICIYYISGKGQISRASWVEGDDVWTNAIVSDSVLPDPACQLSVAVLPELKQNMLTYLIKGNTNLQYLADPWVAA